MTASLTLEEIVSKTSDLPTIPEAAIAVMREVDNPEASAASVANHISRDQSLSAKVLRLSNSSYYGLAGQVTDLRDAVVVLGMRSVRNLAVVAATYPWMAKPFTGYRLSPEDMWAHSVGVGVAGKMLAKKTKKACPESTFVAGLLHNIGKTALSIWLENKLESMMKLAQATDQTFDAVERKILGYDHQEVGAYLGERWNLPETFVTAMRYHHHPNDIADPVVDCIHIADYITMSMGFGLGGDGLRYELAPEALDRLGIKTEELDEIMASYLSDYESFGKLMEALKAA